MQIKLKNKIGQIAFSLVFLSLFSSQLLAAEYSHIYKFEQPKIITLSNGRQLVEIKGSWQNDLIVGAPILPVRTSQIFIPANEKVASIEIGYGIQKIIEGTFIIQHATKPYPISHKGPITVDKPDPNIYEANASYPSAIHRARKAQFLRGVKIVLVDLMPVLYNPVEGQLKYYNELEVRIRTVKQKRPDWVMPFRNSPKNRGRILRSIENKNDFLRLHPNSVQSKPEGTSTMAEELFPTQEDRQYVVITTADLISAFETLTTHRASAAGGGYTTYIENISNIAANYPGDDLAEKMRNFIKDMYSYHGTQYVLLGGDCDGSPGNQVIPTRGCYATLGTYTDNNIPSDLYFGCLDGSWNSDGNSLWGESTDGEGGGDIEWESDVYVGRIPADNEAEALNHINKIIAFETTGNRPNKTLLVGEKLDSDPNWGGDRMDWVYSYMDSTPKTALYDRDWELNNWPNSVLLGYINSNQYHWINHLGHSNVTYNMKLSNSDVASMTNNNYLLVYTQGCYSGSIDNRNSSGSYGSTDCIGEAITNAYDDRGAFAYIGNSRYGWYTPGYVEGASNLVHKEFMEAVFTYNYTKLGEANQISKTYFYPSGSYRWTAFETNLLGCPATDLKISACTTDTDCDDGAYCNGMEICVEGGCQDGTPPDCPDDELFCTGSEVCDEVSDECSSTGDPCTQGTYCIEDVGTYTCKSSCGNEKCDNGENCDTCSIDCPSNPSGGTPDACWKYDGICHPKKETVACADCSPGYCCGDGFCDVGENSIVCAIDCGSSFCGNSNCEAGEDPCSCPTDCGSPPTEETSCSDGVDNDCDQKTDCYDPGCYGDPACASCFPKDLDCEANAQCCSGRCHSKKGVCL